MYVIYTRIWKGGMYYHIYAASSTHKAAMITTSNAKRLDAALMYMKLQCLFVPYPTNKSDNKKIVDIHQQKVESPLWEWQAVWIQGL